MIRKFFHRFVRLPTGSGHGSPCGAPAAALGSVGPALAEALRPDTGETPVPPDAGPILAVRLERWRYQVLKRLGGRLAAEDGRLAEALDLAANALAGRAPRGRAIRRGWRFAAARRTMRRWRKFGGARSRRSAGGRRGAGRGADAGNFGAVGSPCAVWERGRGWGRGRKEIAECKMQSAKCRVQSASGLAGPSLCRCILSDTASTIAGTADYRHPQAIRRRHLSPDEALFRFANKLTLDMNYLI